MSARYHLVHSGMPSGAFSEFTAADDDDARAQARRSASVGGYRVVALSVYVTGESRRTVDPMKGPL